MAEPTQAPAAATDAAPAEASVDACTAMSVKVHKERKEKKEKKEKKAKKEKKERNEKKDAAADATGAAPALIVVSAPEAGQLARATAPAAQDGTQQPAPASSPVEVEPALVIATPPKAIVRASASASELSTSPPPSPSASSSPASPMSPKSVSLLRMSTDHVSNKKSARSSTLGSTPASQPVAVPSAAAAEQIARSPDSGSPMRNRSNSLLGRLFTRDKSTKEHSPSRASRDEDAPRDRTPERAASPMKDSFNSGKVAPPVARIKAGSWEDLPADIQKALSKASIHKQKALQHWNTLLGCIEFVVKCRFDRTTVYDTDMEKTPNLFAPLWPEHPLYIPIEKIYSPIEELKSYTPNPKAPGGTGLLSARSGFGVVTGGTSPGGAKVAIKKMEEWSRPTSTSHAELAFLKGSSHPNIVAFVQAFKADMQIMLVTEYLDGGGLSDVCRKHNLEEPEMAYIATNVLQGLNYLHERQLLHRDLKTANIMLAKSGEVKIIDFGLVAALFDGKKCGMVGSPFWMPPEMIRLENYSYAADVWSFGITMLELANRMPPNVGSQLKAMFLTATEGIPEKPFTYPKHWGGDCKAFILSCLAFDPNVRPLVPALLKHAWLSKACSMRHFEKCISSAFMGNTYDSLNIS